MDTKGSKYLGRSGYTCFGSKMLHKQGHEQNYPGLFLEEKSDLILSQLKLLLTESNEIKGGKVKCARI
jgi:hypothetical protein